jgi:hypothetical protein
MIVAGCGSSGGAPTDAQSQVTTPLSPSGSGGMVVTCAPDDGAGTTAQTPFPSCSFVDAQACQSDESCGCGCSCQCGVCNCDANGAPGSCNSDADCGPTCEGLQCSNGQCVAKQSSSWNGIFQGTFNWPTTVYEGTCGSGLGAANSSGNTGGRFTVQVVAQDSQLEVLLLSQQASGQPLCQLPFIPNGGKASLVTGSACVTTGLAALCSTTGSIVPPAAIQTFLSGSAALDGDTLTLQLADVFVTPTESGPECDTVPPGETQVNQETMTATLQRCPASGCPQPI